uniref:ATP-dependent RNA helicase TDRD9 n=1 Tax=Takifugu rubripes TaxID=31033 RepID=H2THD8_TAKRU
MKKVFTPEQISEWFTSKSSFVSLKLTNDGAQTLSFYNFYPFGFAFLGAAPPDRAVHDYPTLPITKNREELVSLIENNSVVIIRGATGSGKTTQLPQFILDHYNDKNAPCNIVVTQPRKIGATSIARWVAAQRKCTLGSLVGYQVGLQKMATEHTQLIYVTTGVLLWKLVLIKSLTEYTHIFVDEVHERTEEMDFLLLILRKLLHSNSPYVKIILMSAAINCSEFAEYFGTMVKGKMSPAYVFEVEGVPYAIEEFYLDDIYKLVPFRVQGPHYDHPSISLEMYNVAISLIQSFDELEGKESSKDYKKNGGMTLSERGSVLVFLPGIMEIRYMQEALSKLVHKRLQVYPLHSTVTLEEQNGVFLKPVHGFRKVILSTNIAESSVTVSDVKYVIDFCLARLLMCDKETNYQSLCLSWASKSNCNQRRGRAGRVSKGYCYRLVSKKFWDNEIQDHLIPDMLIAPLGTILLKVKLLDFGDPRSVLSTALSPPNLRDIVKTVLQLKEMGAISAQNDSKCRNEDGELTFLGRVLAHLPVDLYLGKMIVLGHIFGCLNECLIIASSHSLRSFFAIPTMQQLVAELYEDLKTRVSQFNMKVPKDDQPLDYTSKHRLKFIIQVAIAGAYYPNYFAQVDICDDLASKELSGFDPRTTVMVRNIPPYSFLYYKQLQSLFRLCGQVKSISFESSRAYVEFCRSSQDTGVLPEVSLALLLAQQSPSPPMELSVYPIDNIESSAGNRSVTQLKYARVNIDVQNQSVSPLGLFNSNMDPDKLPANRLLVVNITEVMDVGHFWAFQADESSLEKQRHLTAEINKRTLNPVSVSLYPNLLCLAPYSETCEPSFYYRAKILHLRGNTVEVFFIDFGNTAFVACCSLRELPSDLLSQPFQAREIQLVGMRPSAQSIILGNQWSSRARDRFITLVKGHSLMASLYSISHGVMRVQLLIEVEKANTDIVDIMVQEGHAVKAEESFDSRQSHEMLMSLYRDMETGIYIPNSAGRCWDTRKKEEKELIDHLLDHFAKTRQAYSKNKVQLHGPSSPNRVKFYSLNQRAVYKSVNIERRSINGFASIICFPTLLVVTNEERTCYTGALCGLGWNSHTKEAILPEQDIELTFDVKFDVEDISEINALRAAMNRLICEGPNGTCHLSLDKISRLQEECQERLIGLFTKSPSREAVTPIYYEKPGMWNQVDPALKMEYVEPETKSSRHVPFQLHPVTLISS